MKIKEFLIFDIIYPLYYIAYNDVILQIDGASFAYAAIVAFAVPDAVFFLIFRGLFAKYSGRMAWINTVTLAFLIRFLFNFYFIYNIEKTLMYSLASAFYVSLGLSLFVLVHFVIIDLLFSWSVIKKKFLRLSKKS